MALRRIKSTSEADKQNADHECAHNVDVARGLWLYKFIDDSLLLMQKDTISSGGIDISSGGDAAEEDQTDHCWHYEIIDD